MQKTKLNNTTDIPNDTVREILRFTMPPGVSGIDIELRNCHDGHCGGRAYVGGSSYHRNSRKFVVLRIGTERPRSYWREGIFKEGKFIPSRKLIHYKPRFPFLLTPYQYGQHKGKKVWIANRLEMLVYLAAHELRHIWQSKSTSRRGYCWGSRGRYSEIDTEAYAKRKLRAWRARAS